MIKVAVLDDYQNIFEQIIDTHKFKDKFEFRIFNESFKDENETIVMLEEFEALFIMRERTPITSSLIDGLPNLKYIMTSGMRNNAIDLIAAKNRNIIVSGTEINSNPVQNSRIKQPEKFLKKKTLYNGLSGRTPWHQDAGVLSVKGQKQTDLITCWVPFTKTTKKNGCMITIPGLQKKGLFNHDADSTGQAYIRKSELLNKFKTVALEANLGDIVLLSKHTVHCSLPNISNNFRISMDLRYHKSGQPSGRDLLPNFCVRSKNKNKIKINNFKQWLAVWEKAKQKCIPKKYTFKYQTPTFKGNKRDLSNLI